MAGYERGHRGPSDHDRGYDRPDRFANRLGPRDDRAPYRYPVSFAVCSFTQGHSFLSLGLSLYRRREPYRDQPPSREFRGRDPVLRDPPPRDGPARDFPPREAGYRDLPPAPLPAAPVPPVVPQQPASQIVIPPPEPQIDREKVQNALHALLPAISVYTPSYPLKTQDSNSPSFFATAGLSVASESLHKGESICCNTNNQCVLGNKLR